ncbi:hypothetical protein VTI74DRAFT_6711 [Chaetomium olivicolor]
MSGTPTGKKPVPPLLRLPALLRYRIYRFVGLASWDGSPYTFDLHGRDREIAADISGNMLDSPYTNTITVAEGNTIHRGYMELLQPLEQLTKGPNGLAKFYADLRYPWQWTDESKNRPHRREWVEAKKRALRRRVERRVMGDRYDSQCANESKEPEKSLWQHVFYHHN